MKTCFLKCYSLIILALVNSCSSYNSFEGLYGKCDKGYLACTQMLLKPDHTFEYFIFYDVGGGNVLKGTWKQLDQGTIVLNTYKQPHHFKTTYTGKINTELEGKIRIQISDYETTLGLAAVQINNSQQWKTANTNGVVEFDSDHIENVEYAFLNQQEIIEINNSNYNDIEILVKDLDLGAIPMYLTDYTIFKKNRKLIFEHGGSYRKAPLKNKQWR
ncbi:MAG: hypothetical protein HRT68_16380 [Flavobacteriaceae bacterium]|nr:hypothetical protein [Flavobacteriaceae bacterium]